jgi:hypothetical protein
LLRGRLVVGRDVFLDLFGMVVSVGEGIMDVCGAKVWIVLDDLLHRHPPSITHQDNTDPNPCPDDHGTPAATVRDLLDVAKIDLRHGTVVRMVEPLKAGAGTAHGLRAAIEDGRAGLRPPMES